jgi:drug/metabolite transporter (DMT)-like permease
MSHSAIRPNILFCLVLAPTLWGGNFVVGSVIAHDLPGPWINFIRWLIALAVVLPFCSKAVREHRSTLICHWRGLTLMALLGVTLFNTVLYQALQTTSVSIAVVAFAATPFMTAGLEGLVRRRLPSPYLIAGAMIAMAGMLLAQWEALRSGTPLTGIALVLLAAVIWSAYCVSLKYCAPPVPGRASFACQIFLGIVMLVPILTVFESPDTLEIGPEELLGLSYLGVLAAALAFWLWQLAITDIGPTRASLFMNLVPISSILLGAFFLDEPISMIEILAFVFVFFGICLSSHREYSLRKLYSRKPSLIRALGRI